MPGLPILFNLLLPLWDQMALCHLQITVRLSFSEWGIPMPLTIVFLLDPRTRLLTLGM